MAKLNSQEKLFLNQLLTPVTKKLQLSWLMTVISTVLFVFQAWALASIFSVWLHHYFANQTPHVDVLWRYLPWLAVCVFARPALQTLRELISANASLTVKTMLKERLLSALASLGPARTQFGSDGSLSTQVIEQTDALDGFISRFAVQKSGCQYTTDFTDCGGITKSDGGRNFTTDRSACACVYDFNWSHDRQ